MFGQGQGGRRVRRAGRLPLLVLLVAACSGAPRAPGPAVPAAAEPPPDGELPPGPVVIRANPPRCPCTPWEVRFPDHWERVHVVDKSRDGDLLQSLQKQAEEDERLNRDGTWAVVGELQDAPRGDRAGHLHRVLVVSGLPEPVEEPPLEVAPDETPAEAPGDAGEPPTDERPPVPPEPLPP